MFNALLDKLALFFKNRFNISIFNTSNKVNSNMYNNLFELYIFLKKFFKRVKKKLSFRAKILRIRIKIKNKWLIKKLKAIHHIRKKLKKAFVKKHKKIRLTELYKRKLQFKDFFLKNFFERVLVSTWRYEWYVFYKRLPHLYELWFPSYKFNYFYIKSKVYNSKITLSKILNLKNQSNMQFNTRFKINSSTMYYGFLSLWGFIKIWLFSMFVLFITLCSLLINKSNLLPHFIFFWICLLMLLYWLISGFTFFVKKYQFSRYTSVIQRFWRRSYILFWLIESGLLLVFFYLSINSSQESFYMFDQSHILKTHLFSWKLFLIKSLLSLCLILYSYTLLLNFKVSTFSKNIVPFCFITVLLLYLVWLETYQIYWVSNFYANYSWIFDPEEFIWSLEWDGRRTRILNHYIMILFILKFWHIVFILGCWVFFLLRSNELDRLSYALYSFNFQNFIILFLMLWLFMYPWFRQLYHWSVEIPYYWFYVDTHSTFFQNVVYDVYTFYYNLIKSCLFFLAREYDHLVHSTSLVFFTTFDDTRMFIKHTIKDVLFTNIF